MGRALQDQTELTWVDRTGKVLAAPIQVGNFVNFRLSPNQSTLAVSRIDPLTNTSDIWQVDLQRDIATRVTLDRMNDIGPGLVAGG